SRVRFLLLFMLRPRPISPLFPYTTLFRSWIERGFVPDGVGVAQRHTDLREGVRDSQALAKAKHPVEHRGERLTGQVQRPPDDGRSEEHTSELQSPCNLVCRLLLEKKKNKH